MTSSQLISGIFPTCYSVSSLDEYFSVGLELLFTGKGRMLEDCSCIEREGVTMRKPRVLFEQALVENTEGCVKN